ncbi:MAG: bifunctional riboflavin kinase/FAD synthetase [Candidatus Methylumidiphilus sp.]
MSTHLARGLGQLALPAQGCVATIGTFDGVHVGHRAVIENVAAQGRRLGLPVVVVLFEPQPREYFAPANAPARLTRFREKFAHLACLPVDEVLLLHFNRALADSPAEDFIRTVLVDGLRVKYLVVGDDFRFGKNRRGSFALLRQAGAEHSFQVTDTNSVQIDGERVSSTLIRRALAAGAMADAARLLGRPYSVIGRIGHGARLGRQWGFPTANMALLRKKTPLQGVFAVTMTGVSNRPLPGVANLGARPTVDGRPQMRLETHLFDFSADIYGRLVEVHFHAKLREEQRFADVQALRRQIAADAEQARAYFADSD